MKHYLSHETAPNSTAAKGPVLHTAAIAGTQGAKKTSDLLPFCHPLQLDHCKVIWVHAIFFSSSSFTSEQCFFKVHAELVSNYVVEISCRVSSTQRTGMEMEVSCLPLKWLGRWRGPLSLLYNPADQQSLFFRHL